MKFGDLSKYSGMQIPEAKFSTPRVSQTQEASFGIGQSDLKKANAVLGTNVLGLERSESGGGLWIPYLAAVNMYGFVGARSWVASGPFSGCFFEVGTMGGRVYAAHISNEGPTSVNLPAWDKTKREVWFKQKIGLPAAFPAGTTNVAVIVFASNLNKGAVELTRVNVQTSSAGGMSGPIFGVEKVAIG